MSRLTDAEREALVIAWPIEKEPPAAAQRFEWLCEAVERIVKDRDAITWDAAYKRGLADADLQHAADNPYASDDDARESYLRRVESMSPDRTMRRRIAAMRDLKKPPPPPDSWMFRRVSAWWVVASALPMLAFAVALAVWDIDGRLLALLGIAVLGCTAIITALGWRSLLRGEQP